MNVKKTILHRALLGAPLGIVICVCITIGISFAVGDGSYYPVVPAMAEACGGELNAVTVQTALALLYGAVWGGASVIWETERWGLLRQTVTHLVIVSLTTLPVAYAAQWMQRSIGGFLIYFGTFLGIYAVIWIIMMCSVRAGLAGINRKLSNIRK